MQAQLRILALGYSRPSLVHLGCCCLRKLFLSSAKTPINEVNMCPCMHTGKYMQLCTYMQLSKQIYIESPRVEKAIWQLEQ